MVAFTTCRAGHIFVSSSHRLGAEHDQLHPIEAQRLEDVQVAALRLGEQTLVDERRLEQRVGGGQSVRHPAGQEVVGAERLIDDQHGAAAIGRDPVIDETRRIERRFRGDRCWPGVWASNAAGWKETAGLPGNYGATGFGAGVVVSTPGLTDGGVASAQVCSWPCVNLGSVAFRPTGRKYHSDPPEIALQDCGESEPAGPIRLRRPRRGVGTSTSNA